MLTFETSQMSKVAEARRNGQRTGPSISIDRPTRGARDPIRTARSQRGSSDEPHLARRGARNIALQYVVYEAVLTLALRPFMPPERFAALWSPLGASPSWSA